MKNYISTWKFMRVLQLCVGIYFLYQYALSRDTLMLFFGGLMAFQAIFNIGCFSSIGCGINNNVSEASFSDDMDITFEEVK